MACERTGASEREKEREKKGDKEKRLERGASDSPPVARVGAIKKKHPPSLLTTGDNVRTYARRSYEKFLAG